MKEIVLTCMRVYISSCPPLCWTKGTRLHRSWNSWRGSESYQTYLQLEESDVRSRVFGSSDSPGQSPAATARPAALLCHHALLSQLTLTLSSAADGPPLPLLVPAALQELLQVSRLRTTSLPEHLQLMLYSVHCCMFTCLSQSHRSQIHRFLDFIFTSTAHFK